MLKIEDLCIAFKNGSGSAQVVHGISMEINDGEIVGIVGESGSGKTVTALAASGLLKRGDVTTSGKILLDDVDLLECNREKLRKYQGNDIGIIFQEPMTSLNPLMRIGRQVEESLKLHTKLSKSERKERAISAMRSAELAQPEILYNKYPHQLSGGMRQRVMIAAAIISNPKLLIADEPTTALDVTIQAQILELLKKINQELGVSIMFISHDLSVIRRLCDRVVVMKKGRIVESGGTLEIFLNPREDYTKKLIACIPSRKKKRS